MSTSYPKPDIDEDNKPFWDAVRNRQFVLMQCRECGTWYWPAAYCRKHANQPFYGSLEWREASGRGKVSHTTCIIGPSIRLSKTIYPMFML